MHGNIKKGGFAFARPLPQFSSQSFICVVDFLRKIHSACFTLPWSVIIIRFNRLLLCCNVVRCGWSKPGKPSWMLD
ncbi:unnamed protein product, partial [Vitis vinifera]|uniref:Uncharacterized protein n=1 Tax=Vitis vinifera TaxID=29760 RepID=D7TAP5_VITVI